MEPDDYPTKLELIAKRVAKGECILFLGAGVHAPPPEGSEYSYPEAVRPPLGGALTRHLAAMCNFREKFPNEGDGTLQRVSFCFELEDGRGRRDLVAEIDKVVNTGKKPSPVLRALAEFKFPLILTTNYDQLFEQALRLAGKSPMVEHYNKSPQVETADYDGSEQEPFLYKIHGDIKYPESIVVTDEDYIDFVLRMNDEEKFNPVPETFRYQFKRWPTLFVGYSLLDYNLRLFFKTLRWQVDRSRMPTTFAVDPKPDLLIVKVYSAQKSYVTFVSKDVWTFVPDLYRLIFDRKMPQ